MEKVGAVGTVGAVGETAPGSSKTAAAASDPYVGTFLASRRTWTAAAECSNNKCSTQYGVYGLEGERCAVADDEGRGWVMGRV